MADVVFLKIMAMFLVVVAGWLARRYGFLKKDVTATLSVLVVDVAFPSLVFTQMLRTVDGPALRAGWYAPLLCALLIIVAYFAGLLLAPVFSGKSQRNTFIFCVAIPNWIFLPLPIVQALYGDSGVSTVVLCNVGAQAVLWSFGVWILHGSANQAVKHLATNIGLWATALGVIVALIFPAVRGLETLPSNAPAYLLLPGAIVQALALVGSLTIPLSLLAIGAQLGELTIAVHKFPRVLWGILLGRLIVAPLLTVGIGFGLMKLGLNLPEQTRLICYLIATMPVAISCSVMTERFKGDTTLAAEGIFYSTFASLLTVPLIFFIVQRFGL
jgi:predicted permease